MSGITDLRSRVEHAISYSIDALLLKQRDDGSWKGALSSSPAATGDVLIALYLADPIGSSDLIEGAIEFLVTTQSPDGGWGDDLDDCSTINSTAIATAALKIAAPEKKSTIEAGWQCLMNLGGLEAVRDVKRCSLTVLAHKYLAIAGLMSDEDCLRVPIELSLLPAPLRRKLTFAMPTAMAWGVMCQQQNISGIRQWLNRISEPRAFKYLEDIIQFEGPLGGFVESPMMCANVCIALTVANKRRDIVEHCVRYFRNSVHADGAWPVTRDLEVDATNFITAGMLISGLYDDNVKQAVNWVRGAQRIGKFAGTGAPTGGWGWGLPSGWPNSGNTGDALKVLGLAGASNTDLQVERGIRWLQKQQNYDGSWSCFAHISRAAMLDPSFLLVRKARSPKVLYSPCTVMTAEALSGLAHCGVRKGPIVDRALRWLITQQNSSGHFENKWYLGNVAGTSCVLRALNDLGRQDMYTAAHSREWLIKNQNPDGGWGDALGYQISTVEETSMAIIGLLGCGKWSSDAVISGIEWLLRNRNSDGLWDPSLIGVYFLELNYKHDHTANGHALQALGYFRNLVKDKNHETTK